MKNIDERLNFSVRRKHLHQLAAYDFAQIVAGDSAGKSDASSESLLVSYPLCWSSQPFNSPENEMQMRLR